MHSEQGEWRGGLIKKVLEGNKWLGDSLVDKVIVNFGFVIVKVVLRPVFPLIKGTIFYCVKRKLIDRACRSEMY